MANHSSDTVLCNVYFAISVRIFVKLAIHSFPWHLAVSFSFHLT